MAREVSIAKRERTRRYVAEFVKDFNQTQAWIRAFGNVDERPATKASAFLRDPYVRAEVERECQNRMVLADITAERVMMELARCAFFDVRKTVHTRKLPDGSIVQVPLMIGELDDDTARAIGGVQYNLNGSVTLKMADKIAALTVLGKITGAIPIQRTGALALEGKTAGAADYESLDDEEINGMIAACDAEAPDEAHSNTIDVYDDDAHDDETDD